MQIAEPLVSSWQASLALEFERRDAGTVLARREHRGPLRVQKALYPEGREVCHGIVLHPPAGIAGGDELAIDVGVSAGAHALLTTPGAGKWYRSGGPWASQRIDLRVEGNLEWLPQEQIIFDGALAQTRLTVELGAAARFIGLDILCLGRRASGERFARGSLHLGTDIRRYGRLLWRERGCIGGGSPLLDSPVGLAGYSVCATVLAAGSDVPSALVAACRESRPHETGARCGITALPQLLVGRYLGHSAEAAKQWFVGLWRHLRPALFDREAVTPRIWNT
jgi:urease accessory protein